MKKIYLLILTFSILTFSCKKDLNFEKFDKISISPEFGVPLAIVEMKMSDIFKQDSNIVYDPNGFISFIQRQDSVASFPVDSFVTLPSIDPLETDNKLGVLDIDNLTINQSKSLDEMSSNFSTSTKNALTLVAGQVAIFPAITDENSELNNLPINSSQFESISLSQGFMVLEFRNELPVTIDQIRINIYNTSPFQYFISQLIFNNVAPNSSKKDSINLNNVTLSNGLGYSLPVFKTFASSSPVLVDLDDQIKFNIETKGLKAYAGAAIFPTKSIDPQSLEIDLKADDPTIRIRKITFDAGKINYDVTSNIQERLQIKINFIGAKNNGIPMAPIVFDVNNNNKKGIIDLSNVEFDLTSDPSQPYNKLKVDVEPKIISSNQIKNFDSSNFIRASFTFDNLTLKEINGYLGTREIIIQPSEQTFDFLDQFESGFPLDDPKIKIFTSNSIGVPVDVTLDAIGTSAKGATQSLNAPAFTIGYPTVSQKGQVVTDLKTIDKNNSSLVALLNLPPKKISFGGKAQINAAGFTGYNDFILKGTGISVGYEVEMPLSLKTNNLKIEQTTDNPFFEIVNGDTLGKSSLGFEPEDMEYMDLILKIDNGIPFEASLDMFFADNDTTILDTIEVGTLMKSAIADANGRTSTNTTTVATIRLQSEKLAAIKKKNLTKMVVRITIKTFDNGSAPVKIYSDYVSKIGMSVKVKLKLGNK